MLYSQGVPMESLGIPRRRRRRGRNRSARGSGSCSRDHFHLFRGTPSGAWLAHEFEGVFGIDEPLTARSAMRIYDRIDESLRQPEFRPRALFERFNIEVLCTTDAATDTLEHHRQIRDIGLDGRRAADVPAGPGDQHPASAVGTREIDRLSARRRREASRSYAAYIRALESRRAFFKSMGATATDHAAETPFTAELSAGDVHAACSSARSPGKATDSGRARASRATC